MNTPVNNTAEIRSLNIKKIINYLRYSEPVTKKYLADTLGLSFATVSNLCNELIGEGVLVQMSSLNSGGGRIPGLLSINPLSKYYICLNLMRKDELEIALANLGSEVVESKHYKITGDETLDELLGKANELKTELLNARNIADKDVIGAGVAVSGTYNRRDHRLINSNNRVYEKQPLEQKISSVLDLPVSIENDTNLLVLATSEYYQKEIKNSDVIYLFIGEGLGTGIVSEGKIITGRNGLGGETNHVPLGNRNYKCYCGNCGCIETELSLKGFLRIYQEETGKQTSFTAEAWDDFVRNVSEGDRSALKVVEENGRLIGKLISTLINVFGTEDFYIGGITENIFDYLYPNIINEIKNRIFINDLSNINIINSKDYERLIFTGCCEIAFNTWKT